MTGTPRRRSSAASRLIAGTISPAAGAGTDDECEFRARLHYDQTVVMDKFTYVAMPTRVVFGAGAVAQLAAEVERLGAKRALLISTPGRAEMVRSIARGLQVAGIFDQAVMHTPIKAVEAARDMASPVEADCCAPIR